MLVAGTLGLLLTLAALRSADHRVEVAIAARDIDAGTTVTSNDLTFARVAADAHVLDQLITPRGADTLHRVVAARSLHEGELVRATDVRPRAAPHGTRAMSIPIDKSRAVGGRIATGDRVDVIVAGDTEVTIVIAGAEVLAVDDPGAGGLGNDNGDMTVTLAVDAHQSQLLAGAVASGDAFLARATGARSATGTPPLELAGDSG